MAIAYEEGPTEEDDVLAATPDDEELSGMYGGSKRTEMSFGDLSGLPSEIAVFRGPILRCAGSNRGSTRTLSGSDFGQRVT